MNAYVKHIFLVATICVLLSNCKHERSFDPESCGEGQTIDEMMQWMYFKEGSYWIYEEQNLGTLDTVAVVESYSGTSSQGVREFLTVMRSSLDGYNYEYWFNDSWSSENEIKPGCVDRVIDCDKYKPGDFAGGNHFMPFPLFIGNQVNQWHGLNFGPSVITGILESDTLQDQIFHSLIRIEQIFSPQHSFQHSEYTISKNVGIIQKVVIAENEIWELIEFNVVQ